MHIDWLKSLFSMIFILFITFILVAYVSLFTLLRETGIAAIFTSAAFLRPFLFTLLSSVSATALAGLIAIPSAYVLTRYSFPGKELAEGILYLPVLVPPLVSGLALLILFSSSGGQWLAAQGVKFVFTPPGAVLAQFFIATPFAVRTIKVAFSKVERSLEEAAATLGDSPAQVFTRVTLPLARHGIIAGLLLAWSRAMGEFGATIMLAGSLARYTETLPVAIFLRFSTGELETAVAMAALMMILAFLIMIITRKIFTADVT